MLNGARTDVQCIHAISNTFLLQGVNVSESHKSVQYLRETYCNTYGETVTVFHFT